MSACPCGVDLRVRAKAYGGISASRCVGLQNNLFMQMRPEKGKYISPVNEDAIKRSKKRETFSVTFSSIQAFFF